MSDHRSEPIDFYNNLASDGHDLILSIIDLLIIRYYLILSLSM